MTKEPKNIGRKSDGTFASGNSLGGRTRGSRNKTTLAVEALLQNEHEALTRIAIEKALEGDVTALRLCLDRIAPVRRDTPLSFKLSPIHSAADVAVASSDVLAAVAGGDITPEEGARVMSLLAAHATLVETADLEMRLTALEARMDDAKATLGTKWPAK
ncbi:hypothetical protein [Tsuneonella sp. HG222]